MVAKITTPHSILRALNYNEKKVQKGIAECIHAENFLKEAEEMNFHDKLKRFQKQIAKNGRAKTNTMHISLNFDLSDKLSKEKLTAIANDYMEKIGFANQPYLVYKHEDAGHPHVHIVTTNIESDGKRIDTFNIGRNQSETARKELELKYELVRARGRNLQKELFPGKLQLQKLNYGKSELRRTITNILDAVLPQYKFTSLPELNAVLKQYNIIADRCQEGSRTYKHHGLLYRALNENGQKIGVPIKASLIYTKPTLNNLEKRFAENELRRKPDLQKCRTAIDWVMVKPPKTMAEFVKALEKERITAVVRRNENGYVYGLTYIDHNTKSVFNGSDLGKQYSAKAFLERCGLKQAPTQLQKEKENAPNQEKIIEEGSKKHPQKIIEQYPQLSKIFDLLIKPEESYEQLPYEFRTNRKKKKQKQRSRYL
jgi:Relaxase/Mobilisation nuclease domain